MALAQNPKEVLALIQFEKCVQDLKLDSGTVMRFLRARNLDLDNAEAMLRAYVHWRQNNIYEPALVDSNWTPPLEILMKFEAFQCGVDTEGRPVFYTKFGNWLPTRPIFDKFEPFEVMLFTYKTFMALYEKISKVESQQIVLILNNDNIGFSKVFYEIQNWTGLQTLIDIWQLYEANFPETLNRAIFLNTARSFMAIFNLIKPFMAKHTLSKISIFGTNEEKWKPVLNEILPVDAIPPEFGGCAKLTHVYDIVYDGIMTKIKCDTNYNTE